MSKLDVGYSPVIAETAAVSQDDYSVLCKASFIKHWAIVPWNIPSAGLDCLNKVDLLFSMKANRGGTTIEAVHASSRQAGGKVDRYGKGSIGRARTCGCALCLERRQPRGHPGLHKVVVAKGDSLEW